MLIAGISDLPEYSRAYIAWQSSQRQPALRDLRVTRLWLRFCR